MTNKEQIFQLIQAHPEGLDDDDISQMTGIRPRQQVQQLCNELANARRIRRESVAKAGKRRKIHNFPLAEPEVPSLLSAIQSEAIRFRMSALIAATGRGEEDLLDEALQLLALKVLRSNIGSRPEAESPSERAQVQSS